MLLTVVLTSSTLFRCLHRAERKTFDCYAVLMSQHLKFLSEIFFGRNVYDHVFRGVEGVKAVEGSWKLG